jgi:hypothetical protein
MLSVLFSLETSQRSAKPDARNLHTAHMPFHFAQPSTATAHSTQQPQPRKRNSCTQHTKPSYDDARSTQPNTGSTLQHTSFLSTFFWAPSPRPAMAYGPSPMRPKGAFQIGSTVLD